MEGQLRPDPGGTGEKKQENTMSNETYNLIHADEGVEVRDQEGSLTVSGEGRCELGEVRCDLRTEGAVEVTASTVGGDAVSYDDSTLSAATVEGCAVSQGHSTLTAAKVEGVLWCFGHSTLTAEASND